MAEAFLQKALADAGVEAEIHSAGICAYEGSPASTYAVKAMAEKGYDLLAHRSQPLTRSIMESASLVLVMTTMHKIAIEEEYGQLPTPVRLWREHREHGKEVADPWGGNLQSYIAVRDNISEAVGDWVEIVKKMKAEGK